MVGITFMVFITFMGDTGVGDEGKVEALLAETRVGGEGMEQALLAAL